jgi:thioredoxin-dependent peroxiredoxin
MSIAATQKVPNVVFKTRVRDESVGGENPFRWQDVTTQEIFGGKRIVIFSLPGAFTPTCSSTRFWLKALTRSFARQ